MLKSVIQQKSVINLLRNTSAVAKPEKTYNRIKSWQVHSYGEDLQCCSIRNLIISSPTEVLVKIEAASVNPLDIMMRDGYGQTFVKTFRCKNDLVLPVTLGRDFSGVIVDKGHGVGKDFEINDKVYGVIPFHKDGSHAEYAIVDKNHIVRQPCAVSHVEAAAIPYTALTAYSALWFTGGLCYKNSKNLKILILGASGGVGTCAVQMLKAVNATVITTCSTDAVPIVEGLGADCVLDYKDFDYVQNVASQGRYDIILDCAKVGFQNIPATWNFTDYISLTSPILKNTDEYGLLAGLAATAANLIPMNIMSIPQGKCVKWAYFYPSNDGLKFMDKLIRCNYLRPVIYKVFNFEQTPEAYETVREGHLRGKVVIDMLGK